MIKYVFPNVTAVLPAASIVRCMHGVLPKQYYCIGNKILLEYSVGVFLHCSCIKRIIIVISYEDKWFDKLLIDKNLKIVVVKGGDTRAFSAMLVLNNIDINTSCVIVHDAVRSCLHRSDLLSLFKVTQYSRVGGILAIPL